MIEYPQLVVLSDLSNLHRKYPIPEIDKDHIVSSLTHHL